MSSYVKNVYGLFVMLIFTIILTIGFVFELGRGALQISSRQKLQNKLSNKTILEIGCIESKQLNKKLKF